ncbi:hypothetical protein [Methylophaga thiooxydans]|nr:hypothetical protein [Methylophaga thiooxydans]
MASLRTQQAKLASVASAQRLADSKAPSNNEIMAQMDVACVN